MLAQTYIKENYIAVGISITAVNSIKSLRKLHIAYISTNLWVHEETHSLTNSLAIVHIVITVKVKDVWSICKDSRHPYLYEPT